MGPVGQPGITGATGPTGPTGNTGRLSDILAFSFFMSSFQTSGRMNFYNAFFYFL
jgi:hypothetical protein